MIQVKDLEKGYKVGEKIVPVLKKLNCTIEKGEFAAILGPSGCGKSTFLNLLAGLDRPDAGQIMIDGKEIQEFTGQEWDDYRKMRVGIVFQSFHLIPHLNVLENVELAMSVAAKGKKYRRSRAKELLQRVGLGERMKYKPNQLSGGQKQRVAIARALANHPDLILADEPTGALDEKNTEEIMELLLSLNRQDGVTVIMVTHDEQIAVLADRNIKMLDGEIAEDIVWNRQQVEPKPEGSIRKPEDRLRDGFCRGMKLKDSAVLALHNICVKKKRSILTILGIMVGVFSVTLMFGITNGISEKVRKELEELSNMLVVKVTTEEKDIASVEKLKKNLRQEKFVKSVSSQYLLNGMIAYGEGYTEEMVYSCTRGEMEKELLFGSYPQTEGEVAITEKVAEKFMGKGKSKKLLGKKVTLYVSYNTEDIAYAVEKECTVVGITKANVLGIGSNYITDEFAKGISAESVERDVQEQRMNVYIKDGKDREKVLEKVKESGFETVSSEDTVNMINGWIRAVRGFLLLVAGISLAVAAAMVIIVQYMSVAERIKEIGIMRAIGAKKKDIRNLFLMESGIIGLAAGGLGIAAAGGLGDVINGVVQELMPTGFFRVYLISEPILGGFLAASIMLCLAAGFFPAKQAAAVNTIEVLR